MVFFFLVEIFSSVIVTTIVLHACYGLPFFSRVVGTPLILVTSKPKITDAFALAFARGKKYKSMQTLLSIFTSPWRAGNPTIV